MKDGRRIGIIGLGLIGGSIALALNKKYTVVGCSHSADTVRFALENNIIDESVDDYRAFSDCEVVFVCTPLWLVRETVISVAEKTGGSAIITDVGSVKGILEGIRGRIVGGHPMAGTERSGIRAAKERLLENAWYILCGYDDTDNADLELVRKLVLDMGALPITMSAKKHDSLVAKISHLPHMLAYTLVSSALSDDIDIVGSGFTDTTRIASGSPEFWASVAKLNRDNILSEMDKFAMAFADLREAVSSGRDITEFLAKAKKKRDRLSYVKRYMTEYVLYADVPDRVGSIAGIVTRLATAGISIDNVQVINSREGAGGALRLEFKDEKDYTRAKEILQCN